MNTAAIIRAIEEVQARGNGQGDRGEAVDGPDEPWPMSDWDADHRALVEEDRRWRQWP